MSLRDPKIDEEIDKNIEKNMEHLPEEERRKIAALLKKVYTGEISAKQAFNMDDKFLELLYAHGYRLFTAGKYKEAETIFIFLLQVDPTNVTYVKALAFAYKEQNNYELTDLAYVTWSNLAPYDPIPPYYRGELHLSQKNYDEAYLAYGECILKSLVSPEYAPLRERAYLNMQCLEDRAFPGIEKTPLK